MGFSECPPGRPSVRGLPFQYSQIDNAQGPAAARALGISAPKQLLLSTDGSGCYRARGRGSPSCNRTCK
jgi:hypothetical protein